MEQNVYWGGNMKRMYQGADFLGHAEAKKVFLVLREQKHAILSPTTARLVNTTVVEKANNILEIGPGWGFDATLLAAKGIKYHAVDITQENLDHTKCALDLLGFSNYELKRGDGCELPFPDEAFDCVYSNGVLHHTASTEKAVSEAIRVCKHGGRIGLMLYNNWFGTKLARITQPLEDVDKECIVNRYSAREVRALMGRTRIVDMWVETPADTWYGKLLNRIPSHWMLGSFVFVVGVK